MSAFALVELLVAIALVAVVAAAIIVAVDSVTYDGSNSACVTEARNFDKAVHRYYERTNPHRWPPSGKSNSVLAIALVLRVQDLDATSLAKSVGHLDGSQRTPVDLTHGWTYNFDTHTTSSKGCRG